MKKIILFLFILTILSCNTKDKYTITGQFSENQNEEWIYLQKVFSQDIILDSARIINGRFEFKGSIKQPEIYALSNHWQRSKGVCLFILEPSDLKVTINPNNFQNMGDAVLGGKFNNEFHKYSINRDEKFTNKIQRLSKELQTAREEDKSAFSNQIDSLFLAQQDYALDYVIKHQDSPVSISLYMWIYGKLSLAEQGEMLETLSPLKDMTVYKKIKSDYETQLALVDRTPAVKNTDSISYEEISINSNVIKSLIQNSPDKILYIESWSTHCGNCFKEFPYSNILYDKFKNEVEFVYLCIYAKNENEWKEKIREYNLSGQHYLLNTNLGDQYYSEIGIKKI